MDDLTIIQNITAIGLIALFLVVIKPLISVLVEKLKDKMNGSNGYSRLEKMIRNEIEKRITLEKEIKQLNQNHLRSFEWRLQQLEQNTKEMYHKLEDLEMRVIRIETRLNHKA